MIACPPSHHRPRPAERAPPTTALVCWLVMALGGLALLPAGSAWRSLWLAPWCEETVWRWGLQAPLARRWGPRSALWLSAAAFAFAHLLFARTPAEAWHAAATV